VFNENRCKKVFTSQYVFIESSPDSTPFADARDVFGLARKVSDDVAVMLKSVTLADVTPIQLNINLHLYVQLSITFVFWTLVC
jgi:hypothetical protein